VKTSIHQPVQTVPVHLSWQKTRSAKVRKQFWVLEMWSSQNISNWQPKNIV